MRKYRNGYATRPSGVGQLTKEQFGPGGAAECSHGCSGAKPVDNLSPDFFGPGGVAE